MNKFFARIAHAFIEARQRQAEQIIRDHSYFVAQHEDCIAAESLNRTEIAQAECHSSIMPMELKLAA
jgi:hypothetical protein